MDEQNLACLFIKPYETFSMAFNTSRIDAGWMWKRFGWSKSKSLKSFFACPVQDYKDPFGSFLTILIESIVEVFNGFHSDSIMQEVTGTLEQNI